MPDTLDFNTKAVESPRDRWRRLIELGIAPALGGAVGNVTGALAGSHLVSSGLGGAAGALIGIGLSAVLSLNERVPPLTSLAFKRLVLDFEQSSLGSPFLAQQALHNSRAKLIGSGLSSSRLTSPDLLTVTRDAWQGVVLRKPIEILRRYGEITVSSACVSTAALAVLEVMRRELDLSLRINYKSGFGIEQVKSIASGQTDFDFILITDAPFLYSNASPVREYKRIFMCGMQNQVLLVRGDAKRRSKLTIAPDHLDRRILFLPGSSTEAHLDWYGKNLGKVKRTDLAFADFPVRADQLDEGEGIYAWEPVATILAKKHSLIKDEANTFGVPVSAYANKRFFSGRNKQQRALIPTSFREVFIATWNHCVSDPKYAFAALDKLDSFEAIFARAMPESYK